MVARIGDSASSAYVDATAADIRVAEPTERDVKAEASLVRAQQFIRDVGETLQRYATQHPDAAVRAHAKSVLAKAARSKKAVKGAAQAYVSNSGGNDEVSSVYGTSSSVKGAGGRQQRNHDEQSGRDKHKASGVLESQLGGGGHSRSSSVMDNTMAMCVAAIEIGVQDNQKELESAYKVLQKTSNIQASATRLAQLIQDQITDLNAATPPKSGPTVGTIFAGNNNGELWDPNITPPGPTGEYKQLETLCKESGATIDGEPAWTYINDGENNQSPPWSGTFTVSVLQQIYGAVNGESTTAQDDQTTLNTRLQYMVSVLTNNQTMLSNVIDKWTNTMATPVSNMNH